MGDRHQAILATGAEHHEEARVTEAACRRLAEAGVGAGDDGDPIGAGHSLMVGGPGPATVCSFSITLGILFGRDSRQEAREGHGPAPAWAHARRGVTAAGCLRFAWRRHSRHPGRTRSRRAAASLALTIANPNAQAHPNANAAPHSAADAATDAAANAPTHPTTDAAPDRNSSPRSHRTSTVKGPHLAPRRRRRHD